MSLDVLWPAIGYRCLRKVNDFYEESARRHLAWSVIGQMDGKCIIEWQIDSLL